MRQAAHGRATLLVAETNRSRPTWYARQRRVAMASMPSGTMTSTTQCRDDRRNEAYYTLSRYPPRIYLGAQVGLLSTRAVVYLAKAASRHTLLD